MTTLQSALRDDVLLERLLRRGDCLWHARGDRHSALHYACVNGLDTAVALLLEWGAPLDDGVTLLQVALRAGHEGIVLQLLQAGAEHCGYAFVAETAKRPAATAHFIMHGADINMRDIYGNTALHYAAHTNTPFLRTLLSHGAYPDPESSRGGTPLCRAVQSSNLSAVITLLGAGADPDYHLPSLDTLMAASVKNVKILETLILHGASFEVGEDHVTTPLHEAVLSGGCVDLILQYVDPGVSVNGVTALIGAAKKKPSVITPALLEKFASHGADLNTVHPETAWGLPHYMVSAGDLNVVEYLAEKGVRLDGQTTEGQSLLHIVVRLEKRREMLEFLLGWVGLDVVDREGQTALHVAVLNGKTEYIQCLLAAGVGVDLEDCDCRTPLYIAYSHGNRKVAALLHTANAFTGQNTRGIAPYEIAEIHGYDMTASE